MSPLFITHFTSKHRNHLRQSSACFRTEYIHLLSVNRNALLKRHWSCSRCFLHGLEFDVNFLLDGLLLEAKDQLTVLFNQYLNGEQMVSDSTQMFLCKSERNTVDVSLNSARYIFHPISYTNMGNKIPYLQV